MPSVNRVNRTDRGIEQNSLPVSVALRVIMALGYGASLTQMVRHVKCKMCNWVSFD